VPRLDQICGRNVRATRSTSTRCCSSHAKAMPKTTSSRAGRTQTRPRRDSGLLPEHALGQMARRLATERVALFDLLPAVLLGSAQSIAAAWLAKASRTVARRITI
jgi:hypothetical protein